MDAYCSNGAMIAAAIHLEFATDIDETIGTRDPNISIGVGRDTHWPVRPGSRTHKMHTLDGRRKRKLPNLMFPSPELADIFIRQGYTLSWSALVDIFHGRVPGK